MKSKKTLKNLQKVRVVARRPETWIGAVIISALLVITYNSFPARVLSTAPEKIQSEQMVLVAPVPPANTTTIASPSATPDSTPSASVASTASPAAQKTAISVKVKPNQTFWELASRYCKDHDLAEKLATDNGYDSVTRLKTGDVVTITCE